MKTPIQAKNRFFNLKNSHLGLKFLICPPFGRKK